MQTGICALCGQLGKLHESHFLPKGLYKLLRDSNNGNNNPVLISKKISTQKSFQMAQPLLCSACERRFSENGESYVLPLLSGDRRRCGTDCLLSGWARSTTGGIRSRWRPSRSPRHC